jgi:hypothetical protein
MPCCLVTGSEVSPALKAGISIMPSNRAFIAGHLNPGGSPMLTFSRGAGQIS